MDILIVGAGISGCSAARALKDLGHDVSIIEKEDNIGGLCKTQLYQGKIKYEPFGARVFHTDDKEIELFVKRFSKFNDYIHRKGMIIEDKLIPFPISLEGIAKLSQKEEILYELEMRPKVPDYSNFVDCMKSIFGETLYHIFIENYSKKMWDIPLELLPVSMGIKRVEFNKEQDNRLFGSEWQGIPIQGYSSFLEKMIEGIEVMLDNSNFDKNVHDLVLYSGPIDSKSDSC
jgi:UDP-galactopyranose mutase